MRRKHKVLLVLVASGIFTSGARFSFSYLRFRRAEANFRRIARGQSRANVLRLLGEPNYHDGACGEVETPPPGCASEFVYSPPLSAYIDPDYFVVSFDKNERVLKADRYHSRQ